MVASPPARPLPILGRPWFWVLVIGALWCVPLLKSLTAELPEPLPGHDAEQVELALATWEGQAVTLADLRGYLVILADLPLAPAEDAERALERWRAIKDRLRGMGSAVVYVHVARGGSREDLEALVRAERAFHPTRVFLHDPSGSALTDLVTEGHLRGGAFHLLDTHGRERGTYPDTQRGLDALVLDTGQLANWRGSDPPPGEPVRGTTYSSASR